MAVYKATLCYPFLNAIDIRTAQYKDYSAQPMQYLTCQIDSSNTQITGYKIRILSDDNKQVFPVDTTTDGKISPISELQLPALGYDSDSLNINSGFNGTTLRIPFFQSCDDKVLTSYNAVYYKPKYLADHIIADPAQTGLSTPMDNVSNWTYNNGSLTYTWPNATPEERTENNIVLDGKSILTGEIILVLNANNTNAVGLYEVTGVYDEQSQTMTTVLVQQNMITVLGKAVTILKGDQLHNFTYEINNAGTVYIKYSTGGTWVDKNDNEVTMLDSNNSTYKWEITLYQGVPEINIDGSLDYTNVDPKWLDITLASGKIMGSTPNRIQIASDDDDTNGDIYIPEGLDKAPIVLQGKYIELNNSNVAPSGILTGGVRTYVKTYDAVYGHIYPREDALTNIDNAYYCQFFKYSSNPDEILDTDIVNFCFNINMNLTGLEIYSTNVSTQQEQLFSRTWRSWTIDPGDETVSPSNRYISIDITGYENLIKDGDLILLANQTNQEQNGVYQINLITALPETDPATHAKTSHWCLKRVNGYNKWSDYIGKVIYCQNIKNSTGNSRNMNMQSLASAGGTLWDINTASSGSSKLYFTEERPTLLFPQKITQTFNLYDNINNYNSTSSATSIDGKTVCLGDIILYKDRNYATVTAVTNSGYTVSAATQASTDGYYYISNGDQYKELVLKYSTDHFVINWDLFTAKVLHNTTTKTFISPWKTLEPDMELALLNNKYVRYDNSGTYGDPKRWIRVKSLNKTVYYVTHDALTSSLTDSGIPLPSYSKTDDTIPWSYDIRSCFKASDENPFYSYETPYIVLIKNDNTYSDLHMIGGRFFFYVKPEGSEIQFLVYDTQGGVLELLNAADYKAQTVVSGRSVKLRGLYEGFGQSSWESYQWVLYDPDYNIVQDTGKRYDKDMNVSFFGLSNDTDAEITYTALLLVENNFGDIITYVLELKIATGEISNFVTDGGTFSVVFDCSTHSNIINYKEDSYKDDTEDNVFLYSVYRREYNVATNPNPKKSCYSNVTTYNVVPENGIILYEDENLTIPIIGQSKYLYVDQHTYTYQYNPSKSAFEFGEDFKVYKGKWEPVIISDKRQWFRDFNISNDRCYEYVIYPTNYITLQYDMDTAEQTFANFSGLIWTTQDGIDKIYEQGYLTHGTNDTSVYTGEPVQTHWESWSIAELIPETLDLDAPVVRKQYKIDNNNIWLFKYSLETGSQTQNISKDEFPTLGRFSKFGFGNKNYESGSVNALMGSELVLSSKVKYIERLGKSRIMPLSSNEKAAMLEQWNSFCYSKNPKLLKDIKGRSWIVQLTSNSTTPHNFVLGTPDTVSFEWRQVDTTDNIIIYGDYTTEDQEIKSNIGAPLWKSPYQKS